VCRSVGGWGNVPIEAIVHVGVYACVCVYVGVAGCVGGCVGVDVSVWVRGCCSAQPRTHTLTPTHSHSHPYSTK